MTIMSIDLMFDLSLNSAKKRLLTIFLTTASLIALLNVLIPSLGYVNVFFIIKIFRCGVAISGLRLHVDKILLVSRIE